MSSVSIDVQDLYNFQKSHWFPHPIFDMVLVRHVQNQMFELSGRYQKCAVESSADSRWHDLWKFMFVMSCHVHLKDVLAVSVECVFSYKVG